MIIFKFWWHDQKTNILIYIKTWTLQLFLWAKSIFMPTSVVVGINIIDYSITTGVGQESGLTSETSTWCLETGPWATVYGIKVGQPYKYKHHEPQVLHRWYNIIFMYIIYYIFIWICYISVCTIYIIYRYLLCIVS